MNIDLMRKIDYYIGIPLTFIGTLVDKSIKIFKKDINIKVKNVLLIELSEMGSAILVDPAMRKLKNKIDGDIFFVIFSKNKISLQLLNTVKEKNIFTLNESNLSSLIASAIKFIFWCRKNHIDSTIDLELFSRVTALLSFISGATNRVGFYSFFNEGLYRGDFLTKKVAYNPHQHIAKSFIALVDALLCTKQEIPFTKRHIADDEIQITKIVPNEMDKQEVLKTISTKFEKFNPLTHHIILINSNASDLLPQRRWDRDNYCKVIQQILNFNEDIIVLLTGAPSERDWVQVLCNCVHDSRCINFAGDIKFLQLPTLYSLSAFMLTNDSGPAHFASITSMHTFVIFGPETPALYSSLGSTTPIFSALACSPCVSAANHRKTPCDDNQCLKVITPDFVFNTLKFELDKLTNKKS